MGSAVVRMTRKRSVQTLLVLLFCLLPQTPARNLHHTKLSIANVEFLRPQNAWGCELCFLRITEFGCDDITQANAAMCRREVCPRCSYWSHCLPEWCPTPTSTTSTPTPSPTTTSPPTTIFPPFGCTNQTTLTPSPSPPTPSPTTTSPPTTSDSSNSTTSTTTDFI